MRFLRVSCFVGVCFFVTAVFADEFDALRAAAEGTNAVAQKQLADAYAKKMVFWAEKASDAGNGDASLFLGNRYLTGDLIPQDRAKGLQFVEKSLAQGNPSAKEVLYNALYNGSKQECKQAIALVKGWAKKGDARAQAWLGDVYAFPRISRVDYGKAESWYLKSAKQGNIFAQTRLVSMYAIEEKTKEAEKWAMKVLADGTESEKNAVRMACRLHSLAACSGADGDRQTGAR